MHACIHTYIHACTHTHTHLPGTMSLLALRRGSCGCRCADTVGLSEVAPATTITAMLARALRRSHTCTTPCVVPAIRQHTSAYVRMLHTSAYVSIRQHKVRPVQQTLRRAGDDREAVAQHLQIADASVLLLHHAFVGLPVPRIPVCIYRSVCVSTRQYVGIRRHTRVL